MQYSIAVCSRPEADSGFISGSFVGLTVRYKRLKFRDPYLNSSGEILPEAVGCGIFDSFQVKRSKAALRAIGIAFDRLRSFVRSFVRNKIKLIEYTENPLTKHHGILQGHPH